MTPVRGWWAWRRAWRRECRLRDFRHWGKPGIRAQLVDLRSRKLEMDFVLQGDDRSMHVLNASVPRLDVLSAVLALCRRRDRAAATAGTSRASGGGDSQRVPAVGQAIGRLRNRPFGGRGPTTPCSRQAGVVRSSDGMDSSKRRV